MKNKIIASLLALSLFTTAMGDVLTTRLNGRCLVLAARYTGESFWELPSSERGLIYILKCLKSKSPVQSGYECEFEEALIIAKRLAQRPHAQDIPQDITWVDVCDLLGSIQRARPGELVAVLNIKGAWILFPPELKEKLRKSISASATHCAAGG